MKRLGTWTLLISIAWLTGCSNSETTTSALTENSPTAAPVGSGTESSAATQKPPTERSPADNNVAKITGLIDQANTAANQAQQNMDFVAAIQHWQSLESLLTQLHGQNSWQLRSATLAKKMAEEQASVNAQQSQDLRTLLTSQQTIGQKLTQQDNVGALALSRQAALTAQRMFPPDSIMIAKQKLQLARLEQMSGRYAEAIDLYRDSMTAQAKVLGDAHPELESIHVYLAECFRAKNEMVPSIENLKAATRMAEQIWGSQSLNYAKRANDLGVAFHQIRDLTTALKVLRAAESIRREELGMDHPQVAHSLINLATVYLDLNRHELAKQSLEQALPVLEKNLGADHLMVVDCKTKLAMTLMLLDEAVEAEGLLQEVLVACKNSNAKPAVIANCHFRLGVALAKQAKYEAAESHLNQAVEAQDQILGPNNAATVRSKNALATLYRQTGRIELAERLASQVKAISHESSDNSFER